MDLQLVWNIAVFISLLSIFGELLSFSDKQFTGFTGTLASLMVFSFILGVSYVVAWMITRR